jgi:hypothetical protein
LRLACVETGAVPPIHLTLSELVSATRRLDNSGAWALR